MNSCSFEEGYKKGSMHESLVFTHSSLLVHTENSFGYGNKINDNFLHTQGCCINNLIPMVYMQPQGLPLCNSKTKVSVI